MSKTDKTRPFWVRATEYPMVTCVPVHQHEHGPCTLPDRPRDRFGFHRDVCYWDYATAFAYTGEGSCGCPQCTSQYERLLERRLERRRGRAQARAARRGVYDGW